MSLVLESMHNLKYKIHSWLNYYFFVEFVDIALVQLAVIYAADEFGYCHIGEHFRCIQYQQVPNSSNFYE